MPNFPKKQQQCLIPKYLLDYTTELEENHPDPSAPWGGGGGSPIEAGTGIVITGDETKTISVDTEDVAMVADLSGVAFSGDYNDLTNKPTIPTNYVTTNTAQDISESKRFKYDEYGNYTTISNDRVLVSNYAGDRSTRMEYEKLAAHYSWMGNTENMELWADGIHYTKANENNYATNVTLNFNVNPYDNETYYITFPGKNGTVALTSDIITSYNDLTDKPIIPTATSDLYNDSGYITGITSSMVTTALGYTPYDAGNPSGYITSSALAGYATESWVGQQGYLTSVTWNDVSGKPTFATVATSGDYDDLINKPTIPTDTSDLTNGAGYITGITSGMVTTALGYTPGTSNFSGDYTDLTNKPSIPSTATSTSTSTVTPTTTTLVFTYTDNTTETITLLTGATVSTTTTTTLS